MKTFKTNFYPILLLVCCTLALVACDTQTPTPILRSETIPAEAIKMTPEQDAWAPVPAAGWSQPIPIDGLVNTAGGEDSPFITPDGNTLYFFFTPDVNIPAENQVGDGVTGIWVSQWNGDDWQEPQRILLAKSGEPHLDGCPFVDGDWMVFCSARAGNQHGVDLYTAERQNGKWTNVENWSEMNTQQYPVGELHIDNHNNLYFGSDRPGGFGNYDLWYFPWNGDSWGAPLNLGAAVNTSGNENRPFISNDGQELWFDGSSQSGYPGPAIFRSDRQPDGSWGPAEEIISSFAGEPTLTADGNALYFVHHYFSADLNQMIEADIYVSYRLDAGN
jgi:Tol biopolymer transport system component